MAWNVFFLVVLSCYAIYFVLNILYDLFFSKRRGMATDSGVHYNLRDLASDEEEPYLVTGEAGEGEEPVYGEGAYAEGVDAEEEYEEVYDDEEELGYDDDIAPEPTPVLRVEGQGIPLDDFLKDAKSYAKTIF